MPLGLGGWLAVAEASVAEGLALALPTAGAARAVGGGLPGVAAGMPPTGVAIAAAGAASPPVGSTAAGDGVGDGAVGVPAAPIMVLPSCATGLVTAFTAVPASDATGLLVGTPVVGCATAGVELELGLATASRVVLGLEVAGGVGLALGLLAATVVELGLALAAATGPELGLAAGPELGLAAAACVGLGLAAGAVAVVRGVDCVVAVLVVAVLVVAVLVVAAVGLGLELWLIGCPTWLAVCASGCVSPLRAVPADGLADGCGLASGVGEALLGLAVLAGVACVAEAVGVRPATEPLVALGEPLGDVSEPTNDLSAPLDELGVAAEVVCELLGVALLPAAWAAGAQARAKPPIAVSTHAR